MPSMASRVRYSSFSSCRPYRGARLSDYDYLAILDKLIKANAGTPEAQAAQTELDRIMNEISPAWHEQTADYRKIEAARSKIAKLIESLQKVGKK